MAREFKDRVQDTTQTTGTTAFVLDGAAIAGFRTFASAHTSGASLEYFVGLGSDWEVGVGVLTGSNLTRTPLASSNAGSLVNFGAGSKTIFETISAAQIARALTAQDVGFATSIPLGVSGTAYMASQTVSSALTLTPAVGAVRGAMVYLRLVADGVNVPNYSAFKEWGGSSGYDNRAGIENQLQFFFDGFNYFVSITQAIGAVPVPLPASAVSLAGPTSGIVNQTSTAFTVGVTPVGGIISGSVVVTPTPVTGVVFNPTSVTLSSGTTSATFTATPSATGSFTVAVTNNGGLSNPATITYNTSASATAPAQMAAPTATAGNTTASVTMVAPSNGGSPITGYTVVSSPAGMTDSNAGSTNLTHTMTGGTNGTAYTFTSQATNAVGTSTASPASNSVTLAPPFLRMGQLARTTESGAGPYSYTGTGGNYGTSPGPGDGVLSTHFQSGIDGSYVLKILTAPVLTSQEVMLGVDGVATAGLDYNTCAYCVVGHSDGYQQFVNGTPGSKVATVCAANDYLRVTRTGNVLTFDVSKNTGTSYTTVATMTGVSTGVLYLHNILAGTGSFMPIASTGLA